jgi:FkbH-like protein
MDIGIASGMTLPAPLRVALLVSFTGTPLARAVAAEAEAAGLPLSIYEAPYGQYAQALLDAGSGLDVHAPEAIILFVDTRTLMGELFFHPYRIDGDARRAWAADRCAELVALIEAARQRTSATIVVHNLEVPTHSPLGVLESAQAFGFHDAVRHCNALLAERYRQDRQVFVFDFDAFASRVGKDELFDHKLYYLGDLKLRARFLPALARAYLEFLKPLRQMTKKCLVLDCDNTLWGGVIGEDGMERIRLGPTPAGRPFWEFQQYIRALLDRGVILALNSKNNAEDALAVFRAHPHSVLKEGDFAATRINWEHKTDNLRALADELGIGTESMVFVDDDHAQRALVRSLMPEVTVVDLPEDSSLYVSTLMRLDAFSTLTLTEEDRQKGAMYAQEHERRVFQTSAPDMETYLRTLDMVVTIAPATRSTIPRIAQLTQKTNQFTMTSARYTEEDMGRLMEAGGHLVLALHLQDRFGDSGLTGVAVVERGAGEWRMDAFLMSCRILGRCVEEALLAAVLAEARAAGASAVIGLFISSAKNAPAKGFFERQGFVLQGVAEGRETWVYAMARPYPFPGVLKVQYAATP